MKVLPAVFGFLLGALFIFILDRLLPHFHANFKQTEGIKSPWQKTTLLILAITLHNIPEGLAVGVLFGELLREFQKRQLQELLPWQSGLVYKTFLRV